MNIPELIERLREWPTGLDLTDIDKAVEALLAQQVCIEQMLEALAVVLQCRPIGYETMTEARERKIREALALQPCTEVLNKVRADAHCAGMLAAADLLAQRLYKTQDECERAIREAAKS